VELSGLFQVNVLIFFGEPERFDLRKYHRPSPIMHYSTNDNGGAGNRSLTRATSARAVVETRSRPEGKVQD